MGLRQRAPYYLFRAGSGVARGLPLPVVAGLVRGVSPNLGLVMPGRRRMLERHMRRVHGPEADRRTINRAVRHSLGSYGRYWMEAFRLPGTPAADLNRNVTSEGVEHLDAAAAGGKGAVVALPHLGGWEYGGAWFASRGHPVSVVAERLEPPELFEWFVELRLALRMKVVPLGPEAGSALLRALKNNEVLGLVCDRDILGTGVEVEFFGEKTTLPSGPATLAIRTGAPLLPSAAYFTGRHGHHVVIRPPIPIERTGKLRDDVTRVTQLLAYELEELIRAAPDQWHLLQPNWPSDLLAPLP